MEQFSYGYSYDDVLIQPGKSLLSRSEASTETELPSPVKNQKLRLKMPFLSANMSSVTEHAMAISIAQAGGVGVIHRFMPPQKSVEEFLQLKSRDLPVFMSVGVNDEDRLHSLAEVFCPLWCIDIANGYSDAVARTIEKIRKISSIPVTIMAGNVATYAGAAFLREAGADVIKCGIGNGAVCQTRVITGCGKPQVSALIECCEAHDYVIADGGIRNSGDCVKALGLGASAVMIGKLFSECEEAPHPGRYFGMASEEARQLYPCVAESKNTTIEGVSVTLNTTVSKQLSYVSEVVDNLAKGIKSGMSYVGARTLSELRSKAKFMRVTQAGYIEGLPHALFTNKE